MTRVHRRLARSGDDSGMTLPELMVTMFLVSLIGVLVVSLFTGITRTLTRDRAANDSTNIASVAMDQVTRTVHGLADITLGVGGAVGIEKATATSLVFYSYVDTQANAVRPLKLSYELTSANELVESRWTAIPAGMEKWSFPAKATATRVIARNIRASGVEPLFKYLDRAGDALGPVTGLDALDRGKVSAIEVNVRVQADATERAKIVQLQNTIGLPNRVATLGAGK